LASKLYYIKESNGIFAGLETTDTQQSKNGKITLDKPLNEILAEIGDEKLESEKLMFRIYMTSNQDGGKILRNIDSTGTFFVKGIDTGLDRPISKGNEDWFLNANVKAVYMSGYKDILGENGAIVVDHRISKRANFAYGADAQQRQWTLEYGVDPRLVKYIDGIELYKMSGGSVSNTPDYSFENNYNFKVDDLGLIRNENDPNYGYSQYSPLNNFIDIVEMRGANQGSIVVRYVYKLNTPINTILENLKKEAGVEEGKSFGDDFKFEAWFSDNTGENVITNTYSQGFYNIQDIDGDGVVDSEESNKGNSPYIGTPKLEDVYEGDKIVKASVYLNELAGEGNEVVLVNKKGETVASTTISTKDADGKYYSGTKEITFNLDDPTKLGAAGDQLIIRVIPGDERYAEPEVADTIIKEVPKSVGTMKVTKNTNLEGDTKYAMAAIKNAADFPEGTTYGWKEKPNTFEDGNVDATVLVTVPGREDRPFEVPVTLEINTDVYYQFGEDKPTEVPDNYVKVFFDLDGKGKLAPGYVSTLWVNPEKELTVIPPGIVPNRGYVHTGWDQPMKQQFTAKENTIKALYKEVVVTKQPTIQNDEGQEVSDPDYALLTFRPNEGNFEGTTDHSAKRFWILKDHAFNEQDTIEIPSPVKGDNWAFDGWNPNFDENVKVTQDATYTANYKRTLRDIEPVTDSTSEVPTDYVRVTLKRDTNSVGFYPDGVTEVYDVLADGTVRYYDVITQLTARPLDGFEDLKWYEGEKIVTGAERVQGTNPITLTAKAVPDSGILPVEDAEKSIPEGFVRVYLEGVEGITTLTGTTVYDVQTDGTVRYSDIIRYIYESPETVLTLNENYRMPYIFTINGADIEYSAYPIENTKITISATKKDNTVYLPQGADQTVKNGDTVDPKNSISNAADMPDGTKYTFIDNEGQETTINTSALGPQTVRVRVTFPDGTFADVTPSITVIPAEEIIDVTDPDSTKIPDGYIRVKFAEDASVVYGQDAIKAVDIKADKDFRFADVYSRVVVNPADGYREPIEWFNGDKKVDPAGKVAQALEAGNTVLILTPKATKNDNTVYEPTAQEQKVVQGTEVLAKDFISNKEEMPLGTEYSFVDVNGDPAIVVTSKLGKQEIKVQVTFPDGSTKVVDTTINVVPKEDFIKVTDETTQTPEGYVRVKLVNDVTSVQGFNEVYDVKEGYKLGDVLLRAGDPQPAQNYKTPVVWKKGGAYVNIKEDVSDTTLTAYATIKDAYNTSYKPSPQNLTVKQGESVEAEDFISNTNVMPNGTSYRVVDKNGNATTVSTENVGGQDLTIEVVYPDGSTAKVTASLNVETSADIIEVTNPGSEIPNGFARVTLVAGDGVNFNQDAKTVYDVRKDAKIRYADIYAKVDAKAADGYANLKWYDGLNPVTGVETVTDTITLTAKASKTSASEYEPKVEAKDIVQGETPNPADFITNKNDLPKGSYYEFVDENGDTTEVTTTKLGEQTLNIKVSYPDGTSETLTTTMNVVEADKDIYPVKDTSVAPKEGYARVTLTNDETVVFAEDSVTTYDVKIAANLRYADIYSKINAEVTDGYKNIKWYKGDKPVTGVETIKENVTLTAKADKDGWCNLPIALQKDFEEAANKKFEAVGEKEDVYISDYDKDGHTVTVSIMDTDQGFKALSGTGLIDGLVDLYQNHNLVKFKIGNQDTTNPIDKTIIEEGRNLNTIWKNSNEDIKTFQQNIAQFVGLDIVNELGIDSTKATLNDFVGKSVNLQLTVQEAGCKNTVVINYTIKGVKAISSQLKDKISGQNLAVWKDANINRKDGVKLADDASVAQQDKFNDASVEDITAPLRSSANTGNFPGKLKVTFSDGSYTKIDQNLYVRETKEVLSEDNKKIPAPKDAIEVRFDKGNGVASLDQKTMLVKAGTKLVAADFPQASPANGYAGDVIWTGSAASDGHVVTAENNVFTASFKAAGDVIEVTNPENAQKPEGFVRVTLEKDKSVKFAEGVATVYDVRKDANLRYADIYNKVKAQANEGYTSVKWYKREDPVSGTDSITEDVILTAKAAGNNATTFDPQVQSKNIVQGTNPNPADFITNKNELPKGTEFEFVGEVDTSEISNDKEVTIKVFYPDGSSEEVTTTINVVAKDKLADPVIVTPKQGDTSVTGQADGAKTVDVIITGADGNVKATIPNKAVNPDGTFNVAVGSLQDGETIKVVAKADDKAPSEATATVGLELDNIKSTINDANKVAGQDGANLDSDDPFDAVLKEKLDAAKDTVARAEDQDDSNNPRQTDVDKAEAELRDALIKKDANDKVKLVEDKVLAGETPTDQEIKEAQDAIDKIAGSTDPNSADFDQDKKDLQDRLDLVETIKKAEEALNDLNNADKPADQTQALKDAIDEAKDALENGDKTKYQVIIVEIEKAIRELDQEGIVVGVNSLYNGIRTINVQTSVPYASVAIKVDGVVIDTIITNRNGEYAFKFDNPLMEDQELELFATKEGYNSGSYNEIVY
jgi:Rib/alpha/Esp surface antigen-like repeat protein